MRITHIIAGGRYGGAETFFVDLVNALACQGVNQHAITRSYAHRLARLDATSCTYSTARMGGPLDLTSGYKIRRFLRRWKPDIVLAWMSRAANLLQHGPWINVGRLGGYYDLKYYSNCDVLICNTPILVEHCIRQGWDPEKVVCITNFSPKIDVAPVSKASLSTPESSSVALVLARLEDSKAIDIALRAVADIPEMVLWIAGEGSLERELQKLAHSLEIQSRVRFLGWRHDREALLKAADVCLVPSRHEPFGNVVVNAWANGIPVVATRSAGPSSLINHEEDGLLVNVDDYQDMTAAILRILKDGKLARKLLICGESKADKDYSEQSVASAYLDFFQRLKDANVN
ncbi:MAG: glycosyltransferase [Rhodospirillaceae bacterium]